MYCTGSIVKIFKVTPGSMSTVYSVSPSLHQHPLNESGECLSKNLVAPDFTGDDELRYKGATG